MTGRPPPVPVVRIVTELEGRIVNRLGGWAGAVGVIAAAALLVTVTPSDMTTSFEVVGRVGEPIHARLADVEVLDVRVTDRLNITFDEADGSTDGVWVAWMRWSRRAMGRLDLDRHARFASVARPTRHPASSVIGDMMAQPYGAGVAQQGPIVFELPATALDDAGAQVGDDRVRDRVGHPAGLRCRWSSWTSPPSRCCARSTSVSRSFRSSSREHGRRNTVLALVGERRERGFGLAASLVALPIYYDVTYRTEAGDRRVPRRAGRVRGIHLHPHRERRISRRGPRREPGAESATHWSLRSSRSSRVRASVRMRAPDAMRN